MPNYLQEKTYNEIIGITKDHRVIILDHVFEYDGGFKGATRFEMTTLTQEEIDERNDLDNVREYVRDFWQDAVANGTTELGLDDFAEKEREELADGCLYYGDDPSFRREADEAFEKLTDEQKAQFNEIIGVKDKDFVDWESGCCGRIGDDYKAWEWAVLFRPDLLKVIHQYES